MSSACPAASYFAAASPRHLNKLASQRMSIYFFRENDGLRSREKLGASAGLALLSVLAR